MEVIGNVLDLGLGGRFSGIMMMYIITGDIILY